MNPTSAIDALPHDVPAPAQLKRLIAQLKPDREYFAGRLFFQKLLEREGPQGVMDFLLRASRAVDEGDGLDVHLHFNKEETAVFKETYLNIWTRRAFLNTVAWAFPGAVYYAKGLADTMDLAHRTASGEAKPQAATSQVPETTYKQVSNFISDTVYAPAELVIGLALMNEAKEKWVEIKLEQIADAVETLGKRLQVQETLEAQKRLGR